MLYTGRNKRGIKRNRASGTKGVQKKQRVRSGSWFNPLNLPSERCGCNSMYMYQDTLSVRKG